MQGESLFRYSLNGTSTSHEEPLKVFLKLIFNKYKRRSSREYSPEIRMSNLKDDLLVTTLTASTEKLTEDETKFETPQVINLDLDETVIKMRRRNGKRRVKAIKIKITISEDDTQPNQMRRKESTVNTPSEKTANRTVCVIEKFDEDSSSLTLKSLDKEEEIEYVSINEDISGTKTDTKINSEDTLMEFNTQELVHDFMKNEQTANLESEIANTDKEDTPNTSLNILTRYDQSDSIPQQGNKEIICMPSERKSNKIDIDSSSLVLKTPEKEEKIEYVTENEGIVDDRHERFITTQEIVYNFLKNEQTANLKSEMANTKKVDIPNKSLNIQPTSNQTDSLFLQQGNEGISRKMARKECSITDINNSDIKNLSTTRKQSLAYRNECFNSKNRIESIVNSLTSNKINANILNTAVKLPKINNIEENARQQCDMTKSNKEKCCRLNQWTIKEISNKFVEAEKQFSPNYEINSRKLSETKEKRPNKLNESSTTLDKSRDSLIIHEIIMEHYSDILNHFIKKSSKRDMFRKCISTVDEKEKLIEDEPVQSPMNNLCLEHEETLLNGKSLDSGLHDMNISKSMDTLENRCGSEEKVEYDSREFLMEALGPDLMSITSMSQTKLDDNSKSPSPITDYGPSYGVEKSIGSSEISALVSNTDCKSYIYSLYSTVKKTKKKSGRKNLAARPLFPSVSTTVSTNTYNDYESIDKFRIHSKADELSREISVLQNVTSQVLNAINLCNSMPKLYGTTSHLESERILLLATYKMEVLKNELNKEEYEEIEQEQSCGIVKIKKLKFSRPVDVKDKVKSEKQYYMCLVHSGTTVLASEIALAQENGDIIFHKHLEFNFDSLLSDVDIKFRIFSINIKNNRNKKISCFSPNKTYSLKKNNKGSNNNESTHSDTSQLLGNARIGITELSSKNKFKLNLSLHGTISDTFDAEILIQLKLNNNLSGFLTINMGNALWKRRWCALDGCLLKYWSCPSQTDSDPVGTIELKNCITTNVSSVDKSVCPRARTFVLEVKSETGVPKVYLLSADNLSEFTNWKRQINVTLMVLRNWNQLKCQTELLN